MSPNSSTYLGRLLHGDVVVLRRVLNHLHQRLVSGGSEVGRGSVRTVGRLQKTFDDGLEEGRKRRRWRITSVVAGGLVVRGLGQTGRRKSGKKMKIWRKELPLTASKEIGEVGRD